MTQSFAEKLREAAEKQHAEGVLSKFHFGVIKLISKMPRMAAKVERLVVVEMGLDDSTGAIDWSAVDWIAVIKLVIQILLAFGVL